MNPRIHGFPYVASSLVLLGTAGCKGDGSLWLLLFEPNTDPAECEVGVTYNFTGATEPTDEAPSDFLTITQELTQSESAMMGEVTGGNEPVLVIGSRLWLGTKDGSTTKFVWNATETSTTTQAGTGYTYTANLDAQTKETISLEFSGNEAEGTYATTQTVNQSWTETDEWEVKNVGVGQGQIPASQYLLVDGPHGPVPAFNTRAEVECEAPDCALAVVSSCEVKVKVTATEVVADEDEFDALGDASRPSGVPDGGGNGGGGDGIPE